MVYGRRGPAPPGSVSTLLRYHPPPTTHPSPACSLAASTPRPLMLLAPCPPGGVQGRRRLPQPCSGAEAAAGPLAPRGLDARLPPPAPSHGRQGSWQATHSLPHTQAGWMADADAGSGWCWCLSAAPGQSEGDGGRLPSRPPAAAGQGGGGCCGRGVGGGVRAGSAVAAGGSGRTGTGVPGPHPRHTGRQAGRPEAGRHSRLIHAFMVGGASLCVCAGSLSRDRAGRPAGPAPRPQTQHQWGQASSSSSCLLSRRRRRRQQRPGFLLGWWSCRGSSSGPLPPCLLAAPALPRPSSLLHSEASCSRAPSWCPWWWSCQGGGGAEQPVGGGGAGAGARPRAGAPQVHQPAQGQEDYHTDSRATTPAHRQP